MRCLLRSIPKDEKLATPAFLGLAAFHNRVCRAYWRYSFGSIVWVYTSEDLPADSNMKGTLAKVILLGTWEKRARPQNNSRTKTLAGRQFGVIECRS